MSSIRDLFKPIVLRTEVGPGCRLQGNIKRDPESEEQQGPPRKKARKSLEAGQSGRTPGIPKSSKSSATPQTPLSSLGKAAKASARTRSSKRSLASESAPRQETANAPIMMASPDGTLKRGLTWQIFKVSIGHTSSSVKTKKPVISLANQGVTLRIAMTETGATVIFEGGTSSYDIVVKEKYPSRVKFAIAFIFDHSRSRLYVFDFMGERPLGHLSTKHLDLFDWLSRPKSNLGTSVTYKAMSGLEKTMSQPLKCWWLNIVEESEGYEGRKRKNIEDKCESDSDRERTPSDNESDDAGARGDSDGFISDNFHSDGGIVGGTCNDGDDDKDGANEDDNDVYKDLELEGQNDGDDSDL